LVVFVFKLANRDAVKKGTAADVVSVDFVAAGQLDTLCNSFRVDCQYFNLPRVALRGVAASLTLGFVV
jgi:hypothetical protein